MRTVLLLVLVLTANGFVVVFAEGTPKAIGPRNLVWNAGGCCAAAVRDDVDDVGFLTALIDELGDGRALVVGHSNGAMTAFRLACEAADHVAAVAVQAGTVFVDDWGPCPDGVEVRLDVVPGADHRWMDDASVRTWTFLSAHR